MNGQFGSVHDLSDSDRLRLLAVRIMDQDGDVKGSGLLYVTHGCSMAFVLTAAHVVRNIPEKDIVVVECQTDKLDEKNSDKSIYSFEVEGSRIAVDPNYGRDDVRDVGPDEIRKFDAAVIPLELDPVRHAWMENRDEVCFLPDKTELMNQKVTGIGYPAYRQKKELISEDVCEVPAIDDAWDEANPDKAYCSQYTACKHTTSWKLELDITDFKSKEEDGGWSGCILVLSHQKPFVLAGVVLERYPDGKGKVIKGADMHHIRLLLEQELRKSIGPEAQVRVFTGAQAQHCEPAPDDPVIKMVPTRQEKASFFIEESFDPFIREIMPRIKAGTTLFLYGPAGCGKSEVARAMPKLYKSDTQSFTIEFCTSESSDEEHMKATILATETITGKSFLGGTVAERDAEFKRRLEILRPKASHGNSGVKWIIVDNFYHPNKRMSELLQESSYKQFTSLGNIVIFTTRYNPDAGGNCFEVPPLFNAWRAHRRAVRRQMSDLAKVSIRKQHFKKCYTLTGGNLLLADWTRKTLRWVEMKDILKAMKTGNFPAETFFGEIVDDRSRSERPLKDLVHDLYNTGCLEPEAQNVLALLQFVGRNGYSCKGFSQLLNQNQRTLLGRLANTGWCMVKDRKITMDPALKLTCRVRNLMPDQAELRELLEKMHSAYLDPRKKAHHSAIRAYYKAAKKAVPALFDADMLQWNREICDM